MKILAHSAGSRFGGTIGWPDTKLDHSRWRAYFEKFSSVVALVAVAIVVLPQVASDDQNGALNVQATQNQSAKDQTTTPAGQYARPPRGEKFIGFYSGVPYTYNADMTFKNPGVTDLLVRDVGWDGRPFKAPIYYGIRAQSWSDTSPFGGMLDFTHGKVYSQKKQMVELEGTLNGKKVPPRAKIEDIFHHFEFTHGHNMLTLNGMYRLPQPHARLSPYIGAGAGIALPHTEIQFKGSRVRTYEYQYVGPVLQALIGIEFRVPRLSYFLEYKFSIAWYEVPLTKRDGTLGVFDIYNQLMRWWSGKPPENGYAWTTLVSHQLIGGMGVRYGAAAVAAP